MSKTKLSRAERRAKEKAAAKQRRRPDWKLVSAMMLFFFSAFLLISFHGEIRPDGFVLAGIVPLMIYIATMWMPRFFPADKLLLALANFLCALGVLVLYVFMMPHANVLRNCGTGFHYAIWVYIPRR